MGHNFFKLLVSSLCIRKFMQMIYFSSELWELLSSCVRVSLQATDSTLNEGTNSVITSKSGWEGGLLYVVVQRAP